MTRHIGGPIGAQQLAQLLGDRIGHERDNARPHDLALADARDHARRSLSALRAIDAGAVRGDQFAAIGRCGALLVDLVAELERIAGRRA